MEGGQPIKEDRSLRLQAGFTLIEFLVGLSIFTALISLSLQGYLSIKKQLEAGENIIMLQQEAVLFIQYLEREVSCSERNYTTGENLIFFHGSDFYSYKRVGQTIVRELNGDGYITVCYNVDKLNFTTNEQGISIELKLKKGKASWAVDVFLPKQTVVMSP